MPGKEPKDDGIFGRCSKKRSRSKTVSFLFNVRRLRGSRGDSKGVGVGLMGVYRVGTTKQPLEIAGKTTIRRDTTKTTTRHFVRGNYVHALRKSKVLKL